MGAEEMLADAIDRVYSVFGGYLRPPSVEFCGYCYTPEQIDFLRRTPLRELDLELSRLLTWEASDHFDRTAVYKHYLPRILEYLAPPIRGEDLVPEHLFETLRAHDFRNWPEVEREAFWSYGVAMEKALGEADPEAARQWRIAAGKLSGSPYPNDGLLSSDPPP